MPPGGNGLERESDHLAVFADRLTRSQRAKSELVAQRNVFESLYRGGLVLTLDLYDFPRAQRSQCGRHVIGRVQNHRCSAAGWAGRVQSASPMRLTTSSPSPSTSPQVSVPLAISRTSASKASAAASIG